MKFLAAVVVAAAIAVPLRADRSMNSGSPRAESRGEIIEQVLVKVNGDIITKTDLEVRQIAAIRQQMNSRVDAESLKNDAELKKMLLTITPQILVDTIDELLLIQIGKEKGYKLSDDQFTKWLENLRKEQNLQDDQKFQAALRQEGMTIDDLRRNVERQYLRTRVQQDEIGGKLSITEEEARQYYLAHKEEFAEAAAVTLREILIEVPTSTQKGQSGINVGDDDEAAKKATAVRGRISGGEDFATLAAEVSASASKANGGLIGPIPVKDLTEELRKTVEGMKPGEVTQPIRTARGFLILKLETMKEAAAQPFESVRDLVADRVYDARQEGEMRKMFARLRSRAIIEWKNQDLKKLYEQGIAARATGNTN
jgi:peptidyl-prolyl cis-trans isomerase SurA